MHVEITAIPKQVRCIGLNNLQVGDSFELYRETGAESDNHWFNYGSMKQFENNLDDLIVNGIEFKVTNEKAE